MNLKTNVLPVCLFLFLAATLGRPALASNPPAPGFQMAAPTPASFEDALAVFSGGSPQPRGAGAGSEIEISPEIQALARALDNDPVKIYEYVCNNIEYTPVNGAVNGATATLLSKRGNDIDQSALLIALLKAADPANDAMYARAILFYSTEALAEVLNVDADQVQNALLVNQLPADYWDTNTVWTSRIWVRTTIGGTVYWLDPAYDKEYDTSDGIDLLSIAGYSRTQFLARAASGATVTSNSIRNANEANIRSDLASFSSNLVADIRSQHPNDDVLEVLGGRKIRRKSISALPSMLPYDPLMHEPSYVTGTVLPSYFYWKLSVQLPGLAYKTNLLELAGKRVSVFFTGVNNAPQLWVDGSVKATGSATTTGQFYNMTVSLERFNPTNYVTTNSCILQVKSGGSYNLLNDFGAASPAVIGRAAQRLARDRAAGMSESSEAVRGGTLHLMGLSYGNQFKKQERLISSLNRVSTTLHCLIGLVGQEEGYYIDVPLARGGSHHRSGDMAKARACFRSTAMLHSALEHGMLEQMQKTNRAAVSTVKLLGLGNANNKETYLATSNNWATVRPQLTNYTTQELARLVSYLNATNTLILPKDAAIGLGQWSGVGYVASGDDIQAMMITGGYNGGYSATIGDVMSILAQAAAFGNHIQAPSVGITITPSAEPVNLATGEYFYDSVDLEMGGAEPLGIRFARHYDSGQVGRDGPLRHGWTHNYDIRATAHSNPDFALGGRQATDAVALALYGLIGADLLENDWTARGWLATSLAAQWAMDQMIENAVAIQMGSKSAVYVRLPDGTYNPPPGVAATLVKSNGAYRLEERFGVRYDFNSSHRIGTWQDASGNTLEFSYNAQTNLAAVTNGFGRGLSLTYSGATQLTAVADSSRRSVSYGYNAGNLTSYTDPNGHVWTYAYDSNRWMRALADPLMQVTATNTFDALGMVVTQKNAAGNAWAFFIAPNWRSVEQDPLGGRITYTFDEHGRQLSSEDAVGNCRRIAYDGQGRATNVLDPRGFPSRYQYDANQNLTNMVDALGHSTALAYDAQQRLVMVRDALGNATHYQYDASHRVTNVVDALGNQTATAYYANGLPQSVAGPRGDVTAYTYDGFGNPATITRTDGGTETLTWNARGDLLTRIDANTNTTTFTYDRRRLLTSERDPFQQRITNVYNAARLLVTNIGKRNGTNITTYTPTYKVASIRYPNGGVVSNFYDAADRLVRVRDPLGFTTTNQYDLAGRLVRVIDPLGNAVSNAYDAAGNLVSVRDAAGNIASNQYDALNRLARAFNPLGHVVSNGYDAVGRLVAQIDPKGILTEYEFDALGRRTLERRAGIEHRFEYDAAGNRTAYVNPKAERMGFGFDKMNRLVAETNAVGQVTRMVYDAAGNLRQKINANGQTNFMAYNALNQLTNRVSGAKTVSFWYDPNGNLTNMVDSLGTTRQSFDAMNSLVQVVDPFGQTVSNQYNLAGRRTQIVYPGGKSQTFAYDGASRLTNVQASAFGLTAASYGYDSRNNLTGASLPGGLVAAQSYDAANRRLAWSVSKGGSNLLARTAARDPLGFRTNETIAAGVDALAGAATQTRTHDAADRITGLTQSGPDANRVPSFDAAGNVTQLVVSAMGQTFTTRYSYDSLNRLRAVTHLRNAPDASTVTAAVTQLEYDGQGLLLRITENGNVRCLVRDRVNQLARPIVEMGATTNAVRWFVWANGKLLAQVASNGTIRVAHSDELGKILALTDGNGILTDEYAYQPYGRLIARSGTTEMPFAYMGDYGVWNAGNGLYLTRHRAYDANLMRFLQPDPIGLDGGYNLYAYAKGAPAVFIDPLGLWGIQFGENGINIGVGLPTLLFTADAWWAANQGAAAGLDGMIPFFNPFTDVYADASGNIPLDYQISQFLGSFTRTIFLGAVNASIAEGILSTSGQSLEAISSLDRFLFNQAWLGQVVSETAPTWVNIVYGVASAGINLGSVYDTWQQIQGLASSSMTPGK